MELDNSRGLTGFFSLRYWFRTTGFSDPVRPKFGSLAPSSSTASNRPGVPVRAVRSVQPLIVRKTESWICCPCLQQLGLSGPPPYFFFFSDRPPVWTFLARFPPSLEGITPLHVRDIGRQGSCQFHLPGLTKADSLVFFFFKVLSER